jgi:hypothetical protein
MGGTKRIKRTESALLVAENELFLSLAWNLSAILMGFSHGLNTDGTWILN